MIQQPQSPRNIDSQQTQNRYRRALAEINKINNANKVLKAETEATKTESQHRVKEMTLHIDKIQHEKRHFEEDNRQLRETNNALQKIPEQIRQQHKNLQKEVAYLSNILSQQSTEIDKVNALKENSNLIALINSYEQRQLNYRKDLSRQKYLIDTFKHSLEAAQTELIQEKRRRYKLQELNAGLKADMQRYKQVNKGLLAKHESILSTFISSKHLEGREKYREAETLLNQISRNIELVKSTKTEQQFLQHRTVPIQTFKKIEIEKLKLGQELQSLRKKMKQYKQKSIEILHAEQLYKLSIIKAENLEAQCNTLKEKLAVIQTSMLMNQNDEGSFNRLKQIFTTQEGKSRINNFKNNNHFNLMKTYVLQAKQKMSKALFQKKQYEKKYKAVRQKFAEKTQRVQLLEDQQKILQAKVQGFERLAQRLQIELQRSLNANFQQISKMKEATNSFLSLHAEQTQQSMNFSKNQLATQMQRFQQKQIALRQQISELQQYLAIQKSRSSDIQSQLQQVNEFLAIYKDKFEELQEKNEQFEQNHTVLSENALRFQQLYRQERSRNDLLVSQKQSLTFKLTKIRQQIDIKLRKGSEGQQREVALENELSKLKTQLIQVRSEAAHLHNSLKAAANQIEESRLTISGVARSEGGYHSSLQHNYQQQRQRNKFLQAEIATIKQKVDNITLQAQRAASLQNALAAKNQELNDLKRRAIGFQKQVGFLESQAKRIRTQCDIFKKENGLLKAKMMQGGQELRKSFMAREAQKQKNTQRTSQELVSVIHELREQRRKTAKLEVQLQGLNQQLKRAQQLLQQGRRKQFAIAQQVLTLRSSYDSVCEQNSRIKSQLKFKEGIQQRLTNQVEFLQNRINRLTQENSQFKIKLQSLDLQLSDIDRQLVGLKKYLPEIQSFANERSNINWQQLRNKENVSNFLGRIKKLLKIPTNPEHNFLRQQKRIINPSKIAETQHQRYFENNLYGGIEGREVISESPFENGVEQQNFRYNDYI